MAYDLLIRFYDGPTQAESTQRGTAVLEGTQITISLDGDIDPATSLPREVTIAAGLLVTAGGAAVDHIRAASPARAWDLGDVAGDSHAESTVAWLEDDGIVRVTKASTGAELDFVFAAFESLIAALACAT